MSDVFVARRRNAGSTISPQVFEVDGADTKTEPTMTTMAVCVKPLLTSMKLCGLYFRCTAQANVNTAEKKLRRHWNGYIVYGLVVIILFWINVARIFSVFINILL